MTQLFSNDYKAPSGKLLRVRYETNGDVIKKIKITGDFFLMPEESLDKLEKILEDAPVRERELKMLVDRFFRGTSAQALGITPDDFVKAVLSAEQQVE